MCEEFLKSGSNPNRPHYNERTEFQPFWLPQTLKQIETKSRCGTYLASYLLISEPFPDLLLSNVQALNSKYYFFKLLRSVCSIFFPPCAIQSPE